MPFATLNRCSLKSVTRSLVGSFTLVLFACGSAPAPATPRVGALPAASAAGATALDVTSPQTERAANPTTSAAPSSNAPEPAAPSEPAPFVVGPATFYLGSRPPWSEPPQPQSIAATAAPAPAQWRLEKTISVGKGYLHKVEFSKDVKSVFVLSQQDGVFRQYELRTGQLLQHIQLDHFAEFEAVDFAPYTDTSVFIIREGNLYALNLTTGATTTLLDWQGGDTIDELARPGLFAFSSRSIAPQSGTVTLAWMDGTTPDEALALRIVSAERPDGVTLSADGRFLALNVYPSHVVYLVDLMVQRLVHTFTPPEWGSSVAFSPDGSLLALGGAALHVHDTTTGALVASDSRYGNNIGNLRFTPQGDLLLSAAFDGRARSYALGPTPLVKLPAPQALRHRGTANVYGLGLSPDGRKLATSSGDTTIKIWTR
jgi:WD40 repeat protein